MNIKALLANSKAKIILASAGGGLVLLIIATMLAMRGCEPKEPDANSVRLSHLEYLTKLVETYHDRFGSYPQPTVRSETAKGVQHAWGYRADTPSLASCTVVLDENQQIDALHSVCGGDVYDANGNVIGWKGTLALESALNSLAVAATGERVNEPLSVLISSLPFDPTYTPHPQLRGPGLGEYVYAVRAPEDKAINRGGTQYQIAMTFTDPQTGKKVTTIRGNYFVKTDETHLPTSLIGPGLLMDEHKRPTVQQETSVHVLVDGQIEGFPHPSLGQGESVLRLIAVRRGIRTVIDAAQKRLQALSPLLSEEDPLIEDVRKILEKAQTILSALEMTDGKARIELVEAESRIMGEAIVLQDLMDTYMETMGKDVSAVLQASAEHSDALISVFQDTLEVVQEARAQVLLARDEVVKYLDGEGIEEQSRGRAGRKVLSARELIPDLAMLTNEAGADITNPFLTEEEYTALLKAFGLELPEEILFEDEDTESGSLLDQKQVTIATLVSEVSDLLSEFHLILDEIESDLKSPAASMDEIDSKLRRLTRALQAEYDRISALIPEVEDAETADAVFKEYKAVQNGSGGILEAISKAAHHVQLYGDMSMVPFSSVELSGDTVENEPGLPDLDQYENVLEAKYKGVPYPLP